MKKDISATFILVHFKFRYAILEMCIKGMVSQSFDTCPSFCFMKCRKFVFQKISPFFCQKIKTRTYMEILRHYFLHMDAIYRVLIWKVFFFLEIILNYVVAYLNKVNVQRNNI